MKYAWIREHRDSFPIALMCRLLGVSRSGYYDSVDRPASSRAKRTAKIHDSVRLVFHERHAIYGAPKIADELAKRFEDYEPTESEERPVEEYLLERAVLERARSERQILDAVVAARAAGIPWVRIGELLGTSAQAAQQRYGTVVEQV